MNAIENKRNANLDLIKIVACICVVGLHAVGMGNYTLYYLCDCGVPLFFLVNGYLLFSKDKIDYPYILRKIFKIVKVVFFWNLIITVPVLIFRRKVVNPFKLSFDSLLQKGYLWHFWFFGALILIYLVLPILHHFFFQNKLYHRLGCLFLMCMCIYISASSMIKGYPLHKFVPQSLRLWTWLFFFLTGGLLAVSSYYVYRISLLTHSIFLLIITIINNTAVKKIGYYLIHDRLAEFFYDDLTSIIWYILFFTFLLRIPIKENLKPFINSLSQQTMGIFIIHPILLTVLHTIYIPARTSSAILFWFGIVLLSLIISFVLSKVPIINTLVKL